MIPKKHYTLLVYDLQCQEKKYDYEKFKTFRGWVPMNSGHGNEKLFSMGIEILGLGIRYTAVLNNYLGYSDNHVSNLSLH